MRELTVEGYGVTQTLVRHEDIEMIRQWRTSPEVSRHMFYRGHITPEQQEKWFQSIDNDRNFFWVVHYQGRPIGLNSLKDVDWKTRSGEGGLFIVPEDARQSLVVFRIAIPGLIFQFEQLGLSYIHAAVHPENKRALRYNKSLGHEVDPATLGTDIIRSRLTRERFAQTRAFFRNVFEGELDCRFSGDVPRV